MIIVHNKTLNPDPLASRPRVKAFVVKYPEAAFLVVFVAISLGIATESTNDALVDFMAMFFDKLSYTHFGFRLIWVHCGVVG